MLLCLGAFSVPCILLGTDEKEAQATEVAVNWVKFIDDGRYDVAYSEMAPIVKESVSLQDWMLGLAEVRKPLGKVVERTLKSAFFTTELPGAPSGEYVVVQFRTKFEGREDRVLETITPMLVEGVGWKVSGFYLK